MARAPDILVVMVDQLNGTLFPDGPASWLHTPNIDRIAERSARFANTYSPSPLCAPARAAFMSGCLPSRTGVYDNAAEFPSAIPTWAHHLRHAGYRTCLSGKMHFVGPDQLHGFEERRTTDVYPADFGWTPDYAKPGERIDWWYHNLGSVTGAGIAEITNQMEFDDEVAFHATQWLHQRARENDDPDRRPWALCVSFTHPHDPYVARREFWELYEGCEHLLPEVGALPPEALDPHSRRLMESFDYRHFDIAADDVMRSRRAYFANITYLDSKIGQIMRVLEETRQAENTIVVFTADHGDMLGSHGLWFKMSFREGSNRVPMMIAAPGLAPGRIDAPVSMLDLAPTLLDLAGVDMGGVTPFVDGESVVAMASGAARSGPVPSEYAAEGSVAPMVSLRGERYKLNLCETDPPELYDLDADPHELTNVAGDPVYGEAFSALESEADARWDLAAFDAAVRESQARRHAVYEALRNGRYWPWDFQPMQDAADRYMRNHMDLNVVEERNRYPRFPNPPKP